MLIPSLYYVSFLKWVSVLRDSNANSLMIWMFRGKGRRLTYTVISVTMVCRLCLFVTCCFGFDGFPFSYFLVLLLRCQIQWKSGIKRHWRKWWSRRKMSIIRTNQQILYDLLDLLVLCCIVLLDFIHFHFLWLIRGFFLMFDFCVLSK